MSDYKLSVDRHIENFPVDANGDRYFIDLIEIPEQYRHIKCISTVEFYTLRGRTTKICRENLEPLFGMWYAIYSPPVKDVPTSGRHYVREFRDTVTYEDNIKGLKRYIADGNLHLIMAEEHIAKVSDCLERLARTYLKRDGKIDYHHQWIPLMETSLYLEWYRDRKKADPAFMSRVKALEDRIDSIWKLPPKSKK